MTGIIVLIVYALLMVGATKLFTKQEGGGTSFHVGNRDMGTVVSAMSIAATWIWAPALFTSAEKAYSNGIAGLFWFLVPNILCLILFIPFARKIRREMPDGITLSGYMHEKYKSEPVKRVYLFQLTALTILSTAVQLLAGGKILSMATGLPLWAMTIVLAVIAFSYSQISGIKASVLTDAIQMVFLLLACAIFVPWALKLNGGMTAIQFAGYSGEYGQLDEEEIAAIRNRGESGQTHEIKTETQGTTAAPVEPAGPVTDRDTVEEEPAEVKQFVICPKCGEKIWL